MQVLSLIWGILAFIGLVIAFFPCLGSLNWLNIPFSVIGLIISIIALTKSPPDKKTLAIIGTVLCALAVVAGIFRLIMGAGVV
jgi:hypothetical protein